MICEPYDVVAVPFPFTEKAGSKRRPALVLSQKEFNDGSAHAILAMITTQGHSPWPADTDVHDFKTAGLNVPCLVRLKLFTLDNRLILKRIGRLSAADGQRVMEHLRSSLL